MIYTAEVQHMCPVAKGAYHGPAPIPEEGRWVQAKEISDISGFTHGVGWCAPQQGACKLTLNIKNGIIEEALVETIGCSGMTHSAAMASEILIGKTILEALNTDLVCDAINTAMRRAVRADRIWPVLSLPSPRAAYPWALLWRIWARACALRWVPCSLPRPRDPAIWRWPRAMSPALALNKDDEIVGYEFISLGKMMDFIKKGDDASCGAGEGQGSLRPVRERRQVH